MTLEAPVTVDLASIAGKDAQTLSGQDRGVAARDLFKLDQLDDAEGAVHVVVPSSLRTISPSFLQGMLTRSIRKLGRDQFRSHYVFLTTKSILDQLDDVVLRILARPH